MSQRVRRCPKCRSDQLQVYKTIMELGTTDVGQVEVKDGYLIAPSDFCFGDGVPHISS